MTVTLDIAARSRAVSWDALAPSAQHAARLCLADGLAVMLGALRLEPAVQPFQTQARLYGPGPAPLLAGGTAPAPAAALANGALAHALDFEDTFDRAGLHVNAAVIPTVLALGPDKPLAEVLRAMILGADLACRIGLSLTRDPATRGWYHPPMIGAFGAALAGALLLGLDDKQTVAALSLTQEQFALSDALKRSPASDLRAVRDGFAARAATEAVMLAQAGVTGTTDPVAEDGGLVHMMTGAAPDPAPFADVGNPVLATDVTLKPWPCCRGTHRAIALALDLRAQGVAPADLHDVAFDVAPPDDMLFAPRGDRIRPATAIAAKFSIPFCFAAAILHGAPGLLAFDDAARRDPDTLALAQRASLASCAPGTTPTARLTWANGTQDVSPLPDPPEMRAGDTSFARLTPKFTDCVGRSGALDMLLSLETADPALPVATLLAGLAPA